MSATIVIGTTFTSHPLNAPRHAPAVDATRAEVVAWLHGRLDWEDRLGQLHRERAGSTTPDRVRSSACQPTSTR
jgi:hypothetical protein